MSPDEPPPEGLVNYRLGAIEARLGRIEIHFDERLNGIQLSIGNLSFVRKDVYDADLRRIEQRLTSMDERDGSTRAIAMWALGTTLTVIALVGTLIGILKLVAG